MSNIPSQVLNLNKFQVPASGSLFLENNRGLVDSINRPHQQIFDYFKKLKSLDWDEHEFELEKCALEFKTKPAHLCFKMIQTLAWQWEADSVAANAIVPMAAPFVSDSDLWLAYMRIGDNEGLHALSYSEIVKYGLGESANVLRQVVENSEAAKRLETVTKVLRHVQVVGAKLTIGLIKESDQEARDAVMLFVAAVLVLERVQFMISFAATFAIGETGSFMPIVDTVQKILTDEYTIHIPVGKYVLAHQLTIPQYRESFNSVLPTIEKMIDEVLASELDWNYNHLFGDGEQLAGVTPKMFEDWGLFAVSDVYACLGVKNPHREVVKNPLTYMNDWVNINLNQGSPQEVRRGNYLLNTLVTGDSSEVIDVDGLL